MTPTTLRFGILGAARIAPAALVKPARGHPEVTVEAVAARDVGRAVDFATRHGLPRVLPDYRSLVEDPAIDAVYIPLPNSLHAEWTLAALDAGKHVLCEKPFTSNAAEADRWRWRPAGRGPLRTGGDGGVPLPLPPLGPTHGGDRGQRRARPPPPSRDLAVRPDPQQVRHPLPVPTWPAGP